MSALPRPLGRRGTWAFSVRGEPRRAAAWDAGLALGVGGGGDREGYTGAVQSL